MNTELSHSKTYEGDLILEEPLASLASPLRLLIFLASKHGKWTPMVWGLTAHQHCQQCQISTTNFLFISTNHLHPHSIFFLPTWKGQQGLPINQSTKFPSLGDVIFSLTKLASILHGTCLEINMEKTQLKIVMLWYVAIFVVRNCYFPM